jgi:CubicO group peptidase (beta-lactamase class C family)
MKNRLNAFSIPVSFFLLLLSITFISAEQLDFPDTFAGKRAMEIVALMNGNFSQSAEEYIQNEYTPGFRDAFPLDAHKQIFDTTHRMFGILELADIAASTPTKIKFTLRSDAREAWLDISLDVEAESPHRITVMGVQPGSRPDSSNDNEGKKANPAGNEGVNNSSQASRNAAAVDTEELDRVISAKVDKNEFSGVVLVARYGRPLFQESYGYASKRFSVPNNLDTKFNLGSINKSFTTVSILQLAEQGKLSLDDPIGKYLDIFPPEIAKKVTIRHLLNMRSGWGDFWGNSTYLERLPRLRKVSDYMEFIKDMPLDFEPGSNFQHSNTGFDVAGAVIEAITGMDYFSYVKKNVYDRAGMADSDSYHKDGPVENLAAGYTNMNRNDPDGSGYQWDNSCLMPPRGTPAGGGYSTAGDLLKYDQALRENKLLSGPFTNFFFNRLEGRPGESPSPSGMYRAVGGAPGINAFLAMDLVSGYTFIVLSNYDHPAAVNLAEEIIGMYGLR